MNRQIFISCLAIAFVAVAVSLATARRLESWPYERLFKEADVVVIAKAKSTIDTDDRFDSKIWTTQFLGQRTTFTVESLLKGKLEGKSIDVLHYKLPANVGLENGPLLVSFRTGPIRIERKDLQAQFGPPEYLLFLKRLPDGRYAPVSGPIDPELSVREIYQPLPDIFDK